MPADTHQSETSQSPPAAAWKSPLAERLTAQKNEAGGIPLGVIGCVISSVGAILTCGVLAPVGLVVCVIALREPPRKCAITGVVLGVIGSFIPGILLFAFYATFAFDDETVGGAAQLMTQAPLRRAIQRIESARDEDGKLPSVDRGQAAIGDLRDRWGNQMIYVPLDEEYVIVSAGRDGDFETDDDVRLMPAVEQE